MTGTAAGAASAVDTEAMPNEITRRDIAVVSLILAAAIGAILAYHHTRTGGDFSALLYSDERVYYLSGAQAILDEGLGWFLTPRSLWNAPLNPLWVAAFGGNIAAVKIANLLLFAATGTLVWDMGRRLFGKPAAYIALVTLALYVPFYRFVPTILTEPLFIPLVMLALWLIVAFEDRNTWALGGAGLAFGAATLARPTTQFYPLLLLAIAGLGVLVARRRGTDSWGLLRPTLLIIAGFAMLVVPFVLKNTIALDKPHRCASPPATSPPLTPTSTRRGMRDSSTPRWTALPGIRSTLPCCSRRRHSGSPSVAPVTISGRRATRSPSPNNAAVSICSRSPKCSSPP